VRLTGLPPGSRLTVEALAQVLTHTAGGLKGRPPDCRVVPLINKVELPEQRGVAGQLARQLLASPQVDEVAVGTMAMDEPVSQVMGRVLAIVLAAGGSQRFGQPKLALPWGDTTLLGHAVRVTRASQADQVLVVLGDAAAQLRRSITDPAVQVVVNREWAAGLSTSVRVALEAAGSGWSAVVFMLADQPGVTPAVIDALITRHQRTLAPIVVPTYKGQRGNPALFDRRLRDRLSELKGDRGGQALFDEYSDEIEWVEVDELGILEDIDTPADYDRLRNLLARDPSPRPLGAYPKSVRIDGIVA
jgi:molybdenum cofactor cytidylyltransferase